MRKGGKITTGYPKKSMPPRPDKIEAAFPDKPMPTPRGKTMAPPAAAPPTGNPFAAKMAPPFTAGPPKANPFAPKMAPPFAPKAKAKKAGKKF